MSEQSKPEATKEHMDGLERLAAQDAEHSNTLAEYMLGLMNGIELGRAMEKDKKSA